MLFPLTDRGETAAVGPDAGEEPFARLLGFLLAYKGRLVVAAVLGAILTGLVLCFVPPRYEAEAVVIVDSRRNKLADAEGALSSIVVDHYLTALTSELSLIQSPDLARRVITSLNLLKTHDFRSAVTHMPTAAWFQSAHAYLVDTLGLDWAFAPNDTTSLPDQSGGEAAAPGELRSDPAMENAVKLFEKSLRVENEPKSLTILIAYRSSSPRLAAAVTNAVLQQYIAADEAAKAAANAQSQAWLQDRLDALQREYDASEHQAEAYRAANHLSISADRSPLEQQLIQLRGLQVTARAARGTAVGTVAQSVAETRLADIQQQIDAVQAQIDADNAHDIKLREMDADLASKRTVMTSLTERLVETTGAPLTSPDTRVVSWATVPVDPAFPKYGLMLAAGTLGFTAVAGFAFLGFERLRNGFAGIRELEEELGLVVAGLTPALARGKQRKIARAGAGDTPPFRELSLTVRALAHGPGLETATKVVLVTSAVPGEGKSTMALSLARSAAGGGQRCLLIEADTRKPTLHTSLGMPGSPGLVDLTLDGAPLAAVIRRVPQEKFDFLSAGRRTPDVLTPFTIEGFREALLEIRRAYDVIVIDSAPVMMASEVVVLGGCADLTLFVVKWRTTPREIARKACDLLTRSSAGPCLAVLSQVNLRSLSRDERRMEERYRRHYQFS